MLEDVFSEIGDGGVVQSSCSCTLYDALEHRHTYRQKVIRSKYISLVSQVSVLWKALFPFLTASVDVFSLSRHLCCLAVAMVTAFPPYCCPTCILSEKLWLPYSFKCL